MQRFQHRTRDLPNAANASFRTRRQRARRNFTRSRGARKGTASLTRSRQNRQVLLAIAGSAALRGPPVVDGSLATMLRCRDARWRGSRGAAQSVGGSHAQPRSAQRHCISHAKPPKSPSAPGYCGLCGSAWGPCGRWIVGHHVALPRRAVVGVARAAQVIGGLTRSRGEREGTAPKGSLDITLRYLSHSSPCRERAQILCVLGGSA
jgi:hypothetical protein